MKKIGCLLLLIVYCLGTYITAGFVLADFEHDYPTPPGQRNQHVGFAIGWSMTVFAWGIAPFETNFYQYGWMRPTLVPMPSRDLELENKK